MTTESSPALTPEQWEAKDYRQSARLLDDWAKEQQDRLREDDSTEYVAKLGLSEDGCVVAMSRAHERVVVPPPARAVLAAFALWGQSFGFTREDVAALERAAEVLGDDRVAASLRSVASRIGALLPP
jgi:hypothetical protein